MITSDFAMLLNKVVLAEDDEAIAHLVAATLGDAGYLCLRARDGEEAIVLVRRELPDALILDVMMPKLDGLEVARRLKADVISSRVPILMLTSLGEVDAKVKGLDAGADDYLAKPFDFRELRARVKALIRHSRRERDRNPATNLPGAGALEDHLNERLRAQNASGGVPFSVMHLTFDRFEEFTDREGFRRAEEVIARSGGVILGRARGEAFLAHVGGDDFVLVGEADGLPGLADDVKRELAEAYPDLKLLVSMASAEGATTIEDVSRRLADSKKSAAASAR
jgi:DNA-binding response OmpR family regulator